LENKTHLDKEMVVQEKRLAFTYFIDAGSAKKRIMLCRRR
jgi:hypothetical protein